MPPKPLVSVLVPTYNGERFLAETLESIRAQRYRNLEVIIRDDVSSDGTCAIAEEFMTQDKRFRLVRAEVNGGLQNSVELLKLAKGRFIKFCLQDDLLEPDCIQKLLAPLLVDPKIVLATSPRRPINEFGVDIPLDRLIEATPLVTEDVVIRGREIIRTSLRSTLNVVGEMSTTLFRNHLLEPEAFFAFGEPVSLVLADLAAWFSLLLRGNLYYHGSAALSSWRRHEGQVSMRWDITPLVCMDWVTLLGNAQQKGLFDGTSDVSVARDAISPIFEDARAQLVGSDDPERQAMLIRLEESAAKLASL